MLSLFSAFAFFMLFVLPDIVSHSGFSTWKWKSFERWGMAAKRRPMIPDLTENHLRIGMPRDEVENLLGGREPYYLGANGWGAGTDAFHVDYDSNDCVTSWTVGRY